jgi:hypothetical protein
LSLLYDETTSNGDATDPAGVFAGGGVAARGRGEYDQLIANLNRARDVLPLLEQDVERFLQQLQ